MAVQLEMFGGESTGNLKCTQSLKVYEYPKGADDDPVPLENAKFGDQCKRRYELTEGTIYEFHMTAEDEKTMHKHYLRVNP